MFCKSRRFKKNLRNNSEKLIFRLGQFTMPEMKEKRNNSKNWKF